MFYARDQHSVSRTAISRAALDVLYQLHKAGFQACLVGGGVRDLLLGREPKDFDVATNATPDQIKPLFRRCHLIGRRFRLAHVHINHELIEVATFRAGVVAAPQQSTQGMLLRDNVYGTLEEDALRRDFTLNALYYNIADFSLIDYANGMQDLQAGIIRLIGDPVTRYQEDPVRMLRAVRFAAKLGFQIEPTTEAPLSQLGHLLSGIPAARLTDEVLKLFMIGHALDTFHALQQYGLFAPLFPQTADCLLSADHPSATLLIEQGLRNTDARVHQGLPITPAFLLAILLWEPARLRALQLGAQGMAQYPAMHQAATEVFVLQGQTVSLPKRFSTMTRDIWVLQAGFLSTKGRRPARLITHPRFRAAYDFMLLRTHAGEFDSDIAAWWTDYQAKHGPKPSVARKRRRRPTQ